MFIYKRCSCSTKSSLNKNIQTVSSSLSDLLKLVSVPARLSILFLLEEKPHCVCDIEAHTNFSQSLISHHLSDLISAGVIRNYKTGKFVEYTLTENGKSLVKTLKGLNKEIN